MKEIHDQVKKALIEANQELKSKIDEGRKDIQFQVGDWVLL